MISSSEVSEQKIYWLNESLNNCNLQKSREKWKIKARQNQKRIRELEEENRQLKTNIN